jgi:hypothetical protein
MVGDRIGDEGIADPGHFDPFVNGIAVWVIYFTERQSRTTCRGRSRCTVV